jgi:hypothetical protein
MLEDRAAEIAGKRRTELRDVAIRTRRAGERVRRLLGSKLSIFPRFDQAERGWFQRQPGDANNRSRARGGNGDDRAAPESRDAAWRGSQD